MRLVILDLDELEKDAEWDEYEDGYTAYSESAIKSALVDAERHGHWFDEEVEEAGGIYTYTRCSVCGEYEVSGIESPYCPWCGAKMDDEVEE